MRSEAPALLPILRSQAQGEILAFLYVDPQRDWTISDLSRSLGIPLTTAQGEIARLEESEIITTRKIGRSRLVRANTEHPVASPLSELILMTFGPLPVIAAEFAACRPEHVIIFGSWASRFSGEFGDTPADIDVLVVGDDVDRDCIYAAAERSEHRLNRPVNPVLRGRRSWNQPESDPLVSEIVSGPFIDVLQPRARHNT